MLRKSLIILLFGMFVIGTTQLPAQCSICTKTAEQLGEGPGKALNKGILYLMFTPFIIAGYIGFRWWKREKAIDESH